MIKKYKKYIIQKTKKLKGELNLYKLNYFDEKYKNNLT